MKQQYENILPLLIEREEDELKEQLKSFPPYILYKLTEDLNNLLLEDKMPPDLLKAYQTYWKPISDRDKHPEGYTNDWHGLSLNSVKGKINNVLNGVNRRQRNNINVGNRSVSGVTGDLGNATYESLTKQETVDFLNLTIKINGNEVSINDPFPYETTARGGIRWPDLEVSCSDLDHIGNKLSQLRFIVGGQLYIIQYVNGYFNPLIRNQIPISAFEKAGLPVKIAGNTGERTPRYMQWHDYGSHTDSFAGMSINNLYAWIKLADKIYKTNDFELANNLDPVNTIARNYIRNFLGKSTDLICSVPSDVLKSIFFIIRVLNDYKKEGQNFINQSETGWEDFESMVLKKFEKTPPFPSEWLDIKLSDIQDLQTLLSTLFRLDANGTLKYKEDSTALYSCFNRLRNNFTDDTTGTYYSSYKYYKNNYIDNVMKEFNNALNDLLTKYKDLPSKDKEKFVQDLINDSDLTDRQKQIATRRLNVAAVSPDVYKVTPQDPDQKIDKLPGAYKYTPFEYWEEKLYGYPIIGLLDTGDHNHYVRVSSVYNDALKSKNIALEDLVKAQQKYNKIKDNSDIYDDELEYQDLLKTFKERLQRAQVNYTDKLSKLDKATKLVITGFGDLAKAAENRFENYFKTLQDLYSKMRKLVDDINVIKGYSKEQLLQVFNLKTQEEIKALEKAITDCEQQLQDLNEIKEQYLRTINDLQEQLAKAQQGLANTETKMEEQKAQLEKFNAEMSNLTNDTAVVLVNSYKARAALVDQGNALLDQVNKVKQMNGVEIAAQAPKPLKDDVMNLLGDLYDIIPEAELKAKEKQLVDDVLTDDDVLDD